MRCCSHRRQCGRFMLTSWVHTSLNTTRCRGDDLTLCLFKLWLFSALNLENEHTECMSWVFKPAKGLPSGPVRVLERRARVQVCRCADTTAPPGTCCRKRVPVVDGSGPLGLFSATNPAPPTAPTRPGVYLK